MSKSQSSVGANSSFVMLVTFKHDISQENSSFPDILQLLHDYFTNCFNKLSILPGVDMIFVKVIMVKSGKEIAILYLP